MYNLSEAVEEKGIEKRTACTMYVQANDIKEAEANLHEGMKGTMADWVIVFCSVANDPVSRLIARPDQDT